MTPKKVGEKASVKKCKIEGKNEPCVPVIVFAKHYRASIYIYSD